MSNTTQSKPDRRVLICALAQLYSDCAAIRRELCLLAGDAHVNPATLHAAAYLEEHTRRFEAALGRAAIPLALAAHAKEEGRP